MKTTDYLAVWGAVIGTLVAAWNIYKDVFRDRVRVAARFMVLFPGKQDVFTFDVTNLTAHKIRITHCAGYPARVFHRRWLQRILRRWRPLPETAFMFLSQPQLGTPLPAAIEPWDEATLCFSVERFPVVEDLFVRTADGREWYCPRADIERIQDNNLYKAAREAEREGATATGQ